MNPKTDKAPDKITLEKTYVLVIQGTRIELTQKEAEELYSLLGNTL